jgi:hypothetical protein
MNLDKARVFLDQWVCANIHDGERPQSDVEAAKLADRCLEEAQCQGLTKAELEAAAGEDLVTCMMDAQVASADAKVSDLLEDGD